MKEIAVGRLLYFKDGHPVTLGVHDVRVEHDPVDYLPRGVNLGDGNDLTGGGLLGPIFPTLKGGMTRARRGCLALRRCRL